MAYISHSHIDHASTRERAHGIPSALLLRSLVVAAAAAVAVLALSEGRSTAPSGPADLAVKSDRLASPASGMAAETARVTVDPVARTTTVERGFVADLSPASPMSVEGK